MRINFIDNNKKSITFGYDKALNKRVEKKLQNEPTALNKQLLALNSLCNKTEDEIILKEKKGVSNVETEPLIDLLIELKTTLALSLERFFPSLGYIDTEITKYKEEGATKPTAWREELAECIEAECGVFAYSVENGENVNGAPMNNQNAEEANEDEDIPPTGSSRRPSNNVIEEFKPSSESPNGFSSIGGMNALKVELYDKIIFPIQHPEEAKMDELEYGKKFPRGVLLYGPPGCGKTFIAEAVAIEAGVPLFKLKVGKAGSKYINETSQNFEKAFDAVEKKSKEIGKPCILFIDELDGVAKKRDSGDSTEDLKQLGTLLDLINTARTRGIVILGATNKYEIMDEAVKSRFDSQVFIGLPDQKTREDVLKKNLETKIKGHSLMNSPEDLSAVAAKFEGFSNRSIADLTHSAALIARSNGRRDISKEDYFKVIEENQASKIKSVEIYKSNADQPKLGFKLGK